MYQPVRPSTSGFLGSLYNRVMNGPVGNFIRPLALGLGLSGAPAAGSMFLHGCADPNPFPDGTIPPLSGEDGGVNDGYRNCLPPSDSLLIMVRGRGSVYGNPPTVPMSMPADGEVYISVNRLSVRNGSTGGDGGAGADAGADTGLNGVLQLTGVGQWASMRYPTSSQPITGTEAGRIANRVQGDPLHDLRRPNASGTGTIGWADVIPILSATSMQNDINHDGIYDRYQLGFVWVADITLDTSTCGVSLRLRSTARRPGASIPASGLDFDQVGPVFDYFVQPQYSDGRNNQDFGDEVVTLHQGALEVNGLTLPPVTTDAGVERTSQVVTVCTGNCDDVSDAASNPQTIEVQVIVRPRSNTGTPEDGGTGGSGGADAGMDSGDGGIPPLPGSDSGAGGEGGAPSDGGAGG